jgi:hypothetical protein
MLKAKASSRLEGDPSFAYGIGDAGKPGLGHDHARRGFCRASGGRHGDPDLRLP